MSRLRRQQRQQAREVQADDLLPEASAIEPDVDVTTTPALPPVVLSPFWQGVQARLGRTNLTCPQCGKETFHVQRRTALPDGSAIRERQCGSCGHVSKMLAPAEIPLDGRN